jgi:hypothetical protein
MEVIRIWVHCRKKMGKAKVKLTGVTDVQRVNEGAVVNRGNSVDRGNRGYREGVSGNRGDKGNTLQEQHQQWEET